jgi:stage V sporulation protein D (sporulation-specific penicillin-binding protein)
LLTPYIVERVIDRDGNIITAGGKNVKRQVISEETSNTVSDLIQRVMEGNEATTPGSNAYIEGYANGGKSGTSEKIGEYSAEQMRYIGTFAAAAPANDPVLTILVCVDEPMNGEIYGSRVAAPSVRDTLLDVLPIAGVARGETEQTVTAVPKSKNIIGLTVAAATYNLTDKRLKVRVVGEGEKVISTVPDPGKEIPIGGTVVLYTDTNPRLTALVPDVTGMSLEEANSVIINAGFNFEPDGGAKNNQYATASTQSIKAGATLPLGTVIKVTFSRTEEE